MKKYNIYITVVCAFVLVSVGINGFHTQFEVSNISDEFISNNNTPDDDIPYRHLFVQYADTIGWDWQLLAALCYEESHFNPSAVSYQGASGLMQLMPKTASAFGLNDSTVFIPEDNISAGVRYISRLQNMFRFISDEREKIYFVLASYNAGPAHIMDARRLAKRYGRSAYLWFDNTEYWLQLLQSETYGNDSVVLYGTFPNSYETVEYVKKVVRTEQRFKQLTTIEEVEVQMPEANESI